MFYSKASLEGDFLIVLLQHDSLVKDGGGGGSLYRDPCARFISASAVAFFQRTLSIQI